MGAAGWASHSPLEAGLLLRSEDPHEADGKRVLVHRQTTFAGRAAEERYVRPVAPVLDARQETCVVLDRLDFEGEGVLTQVLLEAGGTRLGIVEELDAVGQPNLVTKMHAGVAAHAP